MAVVHISRPYLRHATLLLLCLFCVELPAAGFTIDRAASRLSGDVYLMDADLRLSLSDEALKALAHGVPVTILVLVDIRRQRAYLWDEAVADLEQRFEIQFHPLSERYVVVNVNTGVTRNYRDLDDALQAVGRLRDYPLLAASLLEPGQSYRVAVEVGLDIEALPAPMRPLAYFDPQWRLSSAPYQWSLNP